MDERFDLSDEELAALLAEVAAEDIELCVRDLSGGSLVTHSVPAGAKVNEIVRDVVAQASLPDGRYALYALREGAGPVRLDPSRTLNENLSDAGLAEHTQIEVVLAPELEGNCV